MSSGQDHFVLAAFLLCIKMVVMVWVNDPTLHFEKGKMVSVCCPRA
jgi:hypothetical protein